MVRRRGQTRKRAQRGLVLEAGIYLLVILVFVAASWLAYQSQVSRARGKLLRDSLLGQAELLQRNRDAELRFPASLYVPATGGLHFSYQTDEGRRLYVLSGGAPRWRLWAGVNAAGARCTCRDCDPPVRFLPADAVCPRGTGPF